MISGESRQFVDILYELEHAITIIVEEVGTNKELFKSIEGTNQRCLQISLQSHAGVVTSSLENDGGLRP